MLGNKREGLTQCEILMIILLSDTNLKFNTYNPLLGINSIIVCYLKTLSLGEVKHLSHEQ